MNSTRAKRARHLLNLGSLYPTAIYTKKQVQNRERVTIFFSGAELTSCKSESITCVNKR